MTKKELAGKVKCHSRDCMIGRFHGFKYLICLGAVSLLLAACSSGGNTGSTSVGNTPTSAGSGGSSVVVKVAAIPPYGEILTDSSGMPLYTFSGSCTGSCSSLWPALTVPAGTKPAGGTGVTGTLKTVKQADGKYQVTYNGLPLYTFVQDTSDHVTGQNISGFTVVKVSSSSESSTTTTTSSNGY